MRGVDYIRFLSKITRANDWRLSFVPFIMGCVYFWLITFQIPVNGNSLKVLTLSLLTTVGFASFGYFINELFDINVDRIAGKINKMALLKPPFRVALFILISSITFIPWLFLPTDNLSFIFIGIEISLFLVYSLPFPRLKSKPYVSGIIDASYAYVIPLLLSFHTYSLFSGKVEFPLYILLFVIAVFFAGARNITIHHVNDIFKDIRSKQLTLPQKIGPNRTNKLLAILLCAEIIFFLLSFILISIKINLFVIWTVLYLAIIVYKLLKIPIPQFTYFSIEPIRHLTDASYQIWFPLCMIGILAGIDWYWLLIMPFHGLLLLPKFSWQKVYNSIHWLKGKFIQYVFIPFKIMVNYGIYYIFKSVGIDLVKEKKSASGYIKSKLK